MWEFIGKKKKMKKWWKIVGVTHQMQINVVQDILEFPILP